ncbi:MAG: Gfo/Idh/MocA family protein [Planctomycetota bacterium]|jgi:predicted dehydrogenase
MKRPVSRRAFQTRLIATGLVAGRFALDLQGTRADQEPTRRYRVGIIGATGRGDYGHAVDVPFTKLPNVEIVAIADAEPKGLQAAIERLKPKHSYANYREMLGKEALDFVAICPRWIDQHHEMLVAAANANCHVYMEKPFCRTMLECDSVRQRFEEKKLKLAVAHISQYSPVLDTALALVRDGVIGEVLELRARGKEDHRGGPEDMWVLGSHVFGLMRSFAQGSPVRCFAQITQRGERIRKEHIVEGNEGLGPLAGDRVQAQYAFANGPVGYFSSRRDMAAKPSRFALQVFGSKGILELESGYLSPAYVLRDGSWSPRRSGTTWEKITSAGIGMEEARSDGSYEGGHLAAIRDLMLAIENDTEPRCSLKDAMGITEMILSAFESERVGREVALPLETRNHPLSLLS